MKGPRWFLAEKAKAKEKAEKAKAEQPPPKEPRKTIKCTDYQF